LNQALKKFQSLKCVKFQSLLDWNSVSVNVDFNGERRVQWSRRLTGLF